MINGYVGGSQIRYPCFNCTKRKIGCHSTCEAYKARAIKEQKVNREFKNWTTKLWVVHEPISMTKARRQKHRKGYAGREKKT